MVTWNGDKLMGALILIVLLSQNAASVSVSIPNSNPSEIVLPYSNFILKSSSPIDYVLSKFHKNQIVSIGEVHENANSLDFLQAILKDKRFIKEVGILVWEFGSIQNQSIVDAALKAEEWDDTMLIKAYKQHTHPWGWPFKDYISVYHTAWKINHAGQGKIIIINADVPIDWELIKLRKDYNKTVFKRDEHMAGIIENKIIKKRLKALFYAGEGHTNKLNANKKRNTVVNLLLAKYPDKIFSITLHKENGYDKKAKHFLRICEGLFDYVFNINGNKPVAFDLNNGPFGRIDKTCARFIPADYNLRDMYDGYVFLGRLENYKRAEFIEDFYDAEYLKKVAERTKMVFGREITKICGINNLSEFPDFFKNFGRADRKYQSLDAWKTKSELPK